MATIMPSIDNLVPSRTLHGTALSWSAVLLVAAS